MPWGYSLYRVLQLLIVDDPAVEALDAGWVDHEGGYCFWVVDAKLSHYLRIIWPKNTDRIM